MNVDELPWDELRESRSDAWCEEKCEELSAFRALRTDKELSWERVIHTDPCDVFCEGEHHEKCPDFIVRDESGDYFGLEVTTLTIPERAKKGSIRRKIVRAAEEQVSDAELPACKIRPIFNPWLTPGNVEARNAAKELLIVVRHLLAELEVSRFEKLEVDRIYKAKCRKSVGKSYEEALVGLNEFQKAFSSVTVCRHDEIDDVRILSSGSWWQAGTDHPDIQSNLRKKGRLYHQKYSQCPCEEVWLLCVAEVLRDPAVPVGEMGVEVGDGFNIDLPFERIYVVGGADGGRRLQ